MFKKLAILTGLMMASTSAYALPANNYSTTDRVIKCSVVQPDGSHADCAVIKNADGSTPAAGDASAAKQDTQITRETEIRDRIGATTSPASGTLLQKMDVLHADMIAPTAPFIDGVALTTGTTAPLTGAAALQSCSANNCVLFTADTTGFRGVSFSTTGTWVGSYTFYYSDDGTNWLSGLGSRGVDAVQQSTGASNQQWYIPALHRYVRVTMTAYTSGTITPVGYLRQTNMDPAPQLTSISPRDNTLVTVTPQTAAATNIIDGLDMTSYAGVTFQAAAGWVGSVNIFQSNDGTNYFSTGGFSINGNPATATVAPGANTFIPAYGRYLRLQVVSYTSGTVTGSAYLKAVSPLGQYASIINTVSTYNSGVQLSYSTAQAASATYTSALFGASVAYSSFGVSFTADQPGTGYIDMSSDGTNWTVAGSVNVTAGTLTAGPTFDIKVNVRASYYRVRFINGPTAQTMFRVYGALTTN